ncbi:MAG: FliH/SctL family protein [Candidatus Cloacimonadales bacterium]|jgi:flagellar assembly protein FliH|nr:hypothetical protein [Candidatus Cloacimonadota bacterium]MDX9976579.1 FliH/SctL family protein [Candidatus Cloacimonadales bacterium]
MINKNETLFEISPGMQVKNARFVSEHPNPELSIFNLHQQQLINRLIESTLEKEIAQLDEKYKQESQKSYQKGIKEGVKQAQHQFQSQVNQTLKIFNQLLDSISSQTDKIKEDQQQELLDFIISIARKVIDTELEINPNIILNVLKNALNLINEREEIRILVNPKDWLTVKENLKNLNVQFELPKQIEVINANEISPGGCRIEFSSGSIDADIETQFQEIRRKLLKNAE